MNQGSEGAGARACWFVGATRGGSEDQSNRFVEEGIWENNYEDKYIDLVKSMKPGDRIAIKASYTRKQDLPFDNRNQTVSVMAIKATGVVTENPGDGRKVRVDWELLATPREWYFYTNRTTIWRVLPGDWEKDALIAFTFEGKPQDIERFRNAPYWRKRFGTRDSDNEVYNWTLFYEAIADKLLGFKDDRPRLLAGIYKIGEISDSLSYLHDKFKDGSEGPLKDICPFTAFGIFNRGITDANRQLIAKELASLLGVDIPVPESFGGIPVLDNRKSMFFSFERNKRKEGDIDALWEVFSEGLKLADSEDSDDRKALAEAYDNASNIYQVGWRITLGLYWARPWAYPTLDERSRTYIEKKLGITIGRNGPRKRCNADDYFAVIDTLESRFQEEAYPVHSFPELSHAAWLYTGKQSESEEEDDEAEELDEEVEEGSAAAITASPIQPYSLDDIVNEGCFIEGSELRKYLKCLREKKNMILQGPTGTGKTWLAKRLAYALVGQKDDSKVRAVQFHPNLSYEDFVRGLRPSADGNLSLVDGPFMEMVTEALKKPSIRHAVVIEEINRGHPAQIFGEMLTLLEADKRTPDEALELCYRMEDGERVFIPDNLYVIGTMNIADRSLALVDLALRRRFAFIDLEPQLGNAWANWIIEEFNFEPEIVAEIQRRVLALNETIASDSTLGPQFRIGHSFVTPPKGATIDDARDWFIQVAETEIRPLLEEYWFDALDKARGASSELVRGF